VSSEQFYPTKIEWEADEFGGPSNLRINGQPVTGVQRIEHIQKIDDFSETVITLRGTVAVSKALERKPPA
jgi:hypothetical protein